MKRNMQKDDKPKKRGSNLTTEEREALFKEQANHWLKAGKSMKDDFEKEADDEQKSMLDALNEED